MFRRRVLVMAMLGLGAAVAAWLAFSFVRSSGPKPLPGIAVIRPPHEVYTLALQGETVWAGGREGLFAIERKTGALRRQVSADVPLRYVRALLVDPDGALWVGHPEGLTRIEGESARTFTKKDGLPDDRVNCLMLDSKGRLWAGTWGGAAFRENGAWRTLTTKEGLLDDMVNVALEAADGSLWFGSFTAPRGGLTVLHGGKSQHFTTRNGLPHNNVNGILQDSSGAVWVATGYLDRGGLCRFVRGSDGWRLDAVLTEKEGLAGAKARSVFQDRHGLYWIGSEYDGMAVWDGNHWGYLTEKDGLSSSETKALLQDEDGGLWMGTSDGVTWLRGGQLQQVTGTLMGRGRP
jgi:ligand-binding sensor domain-containing protein